MNEVAMPQVVKTGAVASLEVTTRESSRYRATINVRLSLPRRTLAVFHRGMVAPLPQSPEAETGLVLTQIPLVMN